MLTLCGWDLQLQVDKVLCQSESWFLGSATDGLGQRWLVQHRRVPETPVWVCAEVSSRMLEEVEAGRAEARDVFRHSLTGTVEIVTADHPGGRTRDRCVPCAELPDGLVAPGRLPAPSRPARSRSRRPRPASVSASPAPSAPLAPPAPVSTGARRRRVLARGATGSS
jgi:hypothetical protein